MSTYMYGVEGVTDHATDEVQKEPHELVTDPVGANTEGFPGVLHHTLVLTSYADHVTARVWAWEEHTKLKLASHERKVDKFGRLAHEIEGIVASIGLTFEIRK
ncbi:hypothetical protein HKD37_02G004462 [Glycine soja]